MLSRNLLSWEQSASDVSRSSWGVLVPIVCDQGCPGLPSRQPTLQPSREPATFVHRRQFSRKHVSAAPKDGIEAKQSAEKKKRWIFFFPSNKNFFYCFLSVLVYFVSFMDCSRERTGEDGEKEEMELEIVPSSSEQSTKYPSTMKHMHTCGRGILTSKTKNFLVSARFSANENISIELVQWNRMERPETTIAQRHRN